MKRSLGGSDSLGAFMSTCSRTADEQISPRPSNSFLYNEFPSSILEGLEDEAFLEEPSGHAVAGEKKRRLSVDQVKSLEKNFEIENKLEPERKVKLAQELGLQPRQVAVWFQNRRARWKTKQLERDYGVLKTNYDALKLSHDALQRDNEALLKEIKELKAKHEEDETRSRLNVSIKEENDLKLQSEMAAETLTDISPSLLLESHVDLNNYESFDIFPCANTFRDGPSDSDSSAVVNEDNSPTPAAISMGCFGQFVKMEEHGVLFSGEEACKLFADDEKWSGDDQWN